MESVLFIAMLAVLAALFFTLIGRTSLGVRRRQTDNRKHIDRQVELTCPIHGLQRETDLVRLTSGETLCSRCYQEAVHGHID